MTLHDQGVDQGVRVLDLRTFLTAPTAVVTQ